MKKILFSLVFTFFFSSAFADEHIETTAVKVTATKVEKELLEVPASVSIITEEDITKAAERALRTRYLLGLFEGSEYDEIPYEKVECKEHIEEAVNMARKGCVLLKNDGVLPIDKSKVKTIGVIGPNADSRAALIGNYHGTSSRYITVLEWIQDVAGENV